MSATGTNEVGAAPLRTNTPTLLLPAYLPFAMRPVAAAVRAALLDRAALDLLWRCNGNLRRLHYTQAELVSDYMGAAAMAGLGGAR